MFGGADVWEWNDGDIKYPGGGGGGGGLFTSLLGVGKCRSRLPNYSGSGSELPTIFQTLETKPYMLATCPMWIDTLIFFAPHDASIEVYFQA